MEKHDYKKLKTKKNKGNKQTGRQAGRQAVKQLSLEKRQLSDGSGPKGSTGAKKSQSLAREREREREIKPGRGIRQPTR